MYLEQIIIKNFRLFEVLDLKLNSGLNILVGENDAGKTALIDSIRHVLGSIDEFRTCYQEIRANVSNWVFLVGELKNRLVY